MSIKSLVFAAIVALAPLPAAAFFISPGSNIADGDTVDIAAGPYFFDVTTQFADVGTGPGQFQFEFTSATAVPAAALSTVLQLSQTLSFSGLSIGWTGGETIALADGFSGVFGLLTAIPAGGSDFLTIAWDDVNGPFANIDLIVGAIPVPPALLLLASGLAGLGVFGHFRRRNRETEAA